MTRRLLISHYLEGRQLEWANSAFLLTLGVSMLVWEKIAKGSILSVVVDLFGGVGTGLFFIVVGAFGMAALIANGSSLALGPHIRSLTAVVRMFIWASFTLSMVRVSLEQGFPSPMIYFFGFQTIAEAYTPYRAVLDVRSHL